MSNLTLSNGPARRLLLPLLLVLLLALAACGADDMDGDDYTLTTGDWALQRITAPDGVVTTIPDPDLYTVQFNADGTITGLADCNNFGGDFTADGDAVTITPGATTRAACGPDSLDALYLDTMGRVVNAELEDNTLVLTTAGGEALLFVNSDDTLALDDDDLDPTAAGFLGLPWWAWLLLVLLIIALLWWLLSRGREETPATTKPVAQADLPESRTTAWQEATETSLVEDDLTRIEGIGPKTQTLLKSEGIRTYAALADTPVGDLQQILENSELNWALGDPTTWPQQARLAANEQWAELEALQARLDRGRQV